MLERLSAPSFYNSDALILFVLLLLSTFALRVLPTREIYDLLNIRTQKSPSDGALSLETAVLSYSRYRLMAGNELNRMRASYAKLGRAHKRIGYDLGYTKKLNKLEETIELNARLAKQVASFAKKEYGLYSCDESWLGGGHALGDLHKVRESLRHFVRDWSEEGRVEREKIFQPIKNVLKQDKSNGQSVLVPGAGLGRLAWEISELGFDTTANELSFFMNIAFRFLLSPSTTRKVSQHILHPYAHWFSHSRTNDALFRSVSFPDVIPRLSNNLRLIERDFLSTPVPKRNDGSSGYDYIVTLFFIDTSLNAIATIEHIHKLLCLGGTWINLGPLLWSSGGYAAVELSLEEVLMLVEGVGFVVKSKGEKNRRTVECEYTADGAAMMKWLYQAEFWVATKS